MVQVIGSSSIVPVNIEFDMYIPINIEFGVWDISLEPTIYWRTGDFEDSLIELGIGSKSGVIRSITLIQFKNMYERQEIKLFDKLPSIEGTPIVEIKNRINETYVDELKDLEIYISSDDLYIYFSKNEVVSLIQNDRVSFGLNKRNSLCCVEIKALSLDEKTQLIS